MSLSLSAQYGASGSSGSAIPGPTVSEQYDHLVAQAQTHHQHHQYQFSAAGFQPFNAPNFVNHSFHHGKLSLTLTIFVCYYSICFPISLPDYQKMAVDDYSKLTADQLAKMTPPLSSENYAKLNEQNWNQAYGGHPGQGYLPHAVTNDYSQMQGYTNANSKYWS